MALPQVRVVYIYIMYTCSLHVHRHCRCDDLYTRHCVVLHVLTFLPPVPSDYTSVSMELTFNSGTTTETVMIPIVGDDVVESTESFTVSLTTGDSAVNLSPQTTTVTIQNDDSKFGKRREELSMNATKLRVCPLNTCTYQSL